MWHQLAIFWLQIPYVISFSNTCYDTTIPVEDVQAAFMTSKAIYDKNLEEGKYIPKIDYKIVFEQEEPVKGEDTVRTLIAEKDFTTIIAFRGIDINNGEINPLITNAILSSDLKSTPVVFDGQLVHVNSFFWDPFRILYKLVKGKLQNQARKYIITGHSLGGALASLLAITAKEDEGRMWENPGTSLITFGQPRVGDRDFSNIHDQMISPFRKLRFVMNLDPVPHLPLWPGSVHHSREIWIAKRISMQQERWFWKVCSPMDPLKCSNMWTFTPNLKDHSLSSYEAHIMNPPLLFYDKKSNQHRRFLDALKYTCEGD